MHLTHLFMHLFIHVLQWSNKSETGTCIPIRGMGLNVLSVPLHKVQLECELFNGENLLAVRSTLSMEGISVILGNGWIGDRTWSKVTQMTDSVHEEAKIELQVAYQSFHRCFLLVR